MRRARYHSKTLQYTRSRRQNLSREKNYDASVRGLREGEPFEKVDGQLQAKHILILDGVPLDVDIKDGYVAMSQGCVSRNSMDEPGGISLGSSVVCLIVYVPGLTGHWTVAFDFLLTSDPSRS